MLLEGGVKAPFLHARHAAWRPRGFTLLEIMIVLGLVALAAILAIPSYQRARKRTQAVSVKSDLKILDDALAQWAVEFNKANGATADFSALRPYIKPATPLYVTGADVFGNVFGPTFTVGAPLCPPAATFEALSDIAEPAFWSPFVTPP